MKALRLVPDRGAHLCIADLGAGSGAILIAALKGFPNATGIGFESSQQAFDFAAANAARLIGTRAQIRHTGWEQARGSASRRTAALRHALRIEERDRLAALTLHRHALHVPSALLLRNVAERDRQVVFLDGGAVRGELRGRDGAAVRTHQRLTSGVPVRFRTARRTHVFLKSGDL